MMFFWVKENRRIVIFLTLIFLMIMVFLIPELVRAGASSSSSGSAKDAKFFSPSSITGAVNVSVLSIESWLRYGTAVLYELSSMILYLVAYIFDNFLAIGLSISFFNTEFIFVAWSNLRDIVNLTFILGAIYVAFLLIKGNSEAWKKSLIMLIVVVFIINFSLFFARVIVDAGNLTARVFYNTISIKIADKDHFSVAKHFYKNEESFEFKSVAAAFYQDLQPEKLINNGTVFNYFVGTQSSVAIFMLILGILIFTNLVIAKNLFSVSLMLITRIVFIIYYMVSAPFYFLALFLPLGKITGGKMEFYTGWLYPLLNKSFCIVTYLFLIWLALLILKSPMAGDFTEIVEGLSAPTGDGEGKSVEHFSAMLPFVAIFIIKALFVVKMLDIAHKTASQMCEDGIGSLGKVGAFAGGTLGVAGKLGGFAVARRIVGRTLGKRIAKSDWANRWAASGKNTTLGKLGKLSLQAGMKMESLQFGGKSYNEKFKERQEEEERIKRRMTTENRRKRSFAEYGLNLNKLDSKEILGFEDDKLNKAYREAGEKGGIGQQAWLDKNRNRIGDITADQIMISKDVIEKAKNSGNNMATRTAIRAVDFLFPDRKESIEALENKQAGVSGVQKEMKDVEDRRKEINKKIEDRVRETDQVAVGLNFAIESASSDVDINQFLEENKEKLSTLGIKEEEIMKNFEELQGVRKEASVKRQGLVEEIQKAEIGDTSGNIKGLREKLTRAEKSMEDSGAFVSAGDKEMVGKLREQISKAKKSSEGLFKLKDKLNQYDIKISREEASLVGGLEKTINDANRRANEGVKEQYRPENDQLEDEGQQLINEKREILEEFAKGVKSEDRLTKESARSA